MISSEKILECLPQKEPFRFIDTVDNIDIDNSEIQCTYTFKSVNPIFDGHFPDNPIVPGVLLIESIAQSGILLMSILYENSIEEKSDYLLSKVEDVKFKEMLFPEQKFLIKTRLMRSLSSFHFFTAKVYNVQRKEILEGKIIVCKKDGHDR